MGRLCSNGVQENWSKGVRNVLLWALSVLVAYFWPRSAIEPLNAVKF